MQVDDLIFENKRRYYIEDLSQRDYNLENTTPHLFEMEDYIVEESSWGEMIRSIVSILLTLYPNKKNDIFDFKLQWTNSKIFSNIERINFKKVDNGIYVNCNHTALHSCWLIQDILEYFEIDVSKIKFIIHRPSSAEPQEIKDYILKKFKEEFSIFLQYNYNKTEEYSNKVIKNIDIYLNPFLSKISKSYDSFFLFDDFATFCNYSSKIEIKINNNPNISNKTKKIISKYIKYLAEFYKI